MRDLRGARSLGDVSAEVGIAKGELSMIERGHALPHAAQVGLLERVYGPHDGWWPRTVLAVLHPDIKRCPCGRELEPSAAKQRVYHEESCRRLRDGLASGVGVE